MTDVVEISGLGAVAAPGRGVSAAFESMLAGERNVRQSEFFDLSFDAPIFHADGIDTQPGDGRTLALLELAADEALAEAGLSDAISGLRVGICLGTTVACQLNDMDFHRAYREGRELPSGTVDQFLSGNPSQWLRRRLGVKGPATTVANACSSGADAIALGAGWIRAGLCDVVIAGGADEINRVPVCGFYSLGVTSPIACAPFDANRQGLNLGEGAGIVILEARAHAEARGHAAPFRLMGCGAAADSHHLTAPHPEGRGLEQAIRLALAQGGLEPSDISFVNAHGTATPDNDKVEGATLARIFGELPVLSTKGYTGHTLGAAGGLEAAFTACSLRAGRLPASAGLEEPDPEIPLVALRDVQSIDGRYALSTSLAFGGNNAAVIIGVNGS